MTYAVSSTQHKNVWLGDRKTNSDVRWYFNNDNFSITASRKSKRAGFEKVIGRRINVFSNGIAARVSGRLERNSISNHYSKGGDEHYKNSWRDACKSRNVEYVKRKPFQANIGILCCVRHQANAQPVILRENGFRKIRYRKLRTNCLGRRES